MHKGKLVGYVVSFLDISERKHIQEALRLTNIELEEKNQRLNEIAVRDGLTGAANRRAFDDHLQAEWNRSLRNDDPVSLIMLDIDYFKNYNDCYGHLAGDACLKRVADVLLSKGYTRRPGDLSARYGGEEFAIILSATDEIAASKIGKRICVDVAEMKIPNKEVPVIEDFNVVTISAGVASMVPQTGDTPDQLIKAADEALYYAKSQGRNRSVSRSDIPEEAIN
jgi:diguanylate cyclase (GGDEF)-like protein